MELTVTDNPERNQFEARTAEGKIAGVVEYERDDTTIVLLHTRVKQAFQGMGVASELARGTLDPLRDSGVTVVNACPFIRRFIERHPDEYDWVVPG